MSEGEHRRDPRIVRGFMVRYRCPTETSWSVSPLRDLSSSGARFMCEGAFAMGSTLELQLILPISREPVSLLARVTWTKPGPWDLIEHGVAFDEAGAGVQETIDAAVAYFLGKERKT